MGRIQIQKERSTKGGRRRDPSDGVLPLDPRDPVLLRIKSGTRTRTTGRLDALAFEHEWRRAR